MLLADLQSYRLNYEETMVSICGGCEQYTVLTVLDEELPAHEGLLGQSDGCSLPFRGSEVDVGKSMRWGKERILAFRTDETESTQRRNKCTRNGQTLYFPLVRSVSSWALLAC